jgi:hypothetical protein
VNEALETGLALYERRHPGASGVIQGSVVVLMLQAYQRKLVGPVPTFPREIEDRIDRYLVERPALAVDREGGT